MAQIEESSLDTEDISAPSNITEWENEPSIADLKKDYQESLNHHDAHVQNVVTWLDNLNITGSARVKKVKGRSTIVPKLIRKQAEWRYAALSESFLSNENIYQTSPVTYEDKKPAELNGLILNNQFNTQIDKVKFIDDYVRTAVDEGTVIVRVGWDFEEEEVDVPDIQPQVITNPQEIQQLGQAAQMLQENPEAAQQQIPPQMIKSIQLSQQLGKPVKLVEVGTKKELRTTKNLPTVDVCEYNSVIIDPTCKGDLHKANFIIFIFETSLSDLEKEGKYTNLDKINIENNAVQNNPDSYNNEDTSFNFSDKPRKKFMAYEYWGFWDTDGTGKTKSILATWVGDVAIRMEHTPFADQGLPFILAQYLPKRASVYGEPDGELLEDNQKISGAVTRGMIDILGRSAAGQTGIRQDALDITNRRKFEAGEDYAFNAHIDPRMAFHTHVYPEIPNSAQFMLQLQNNEAEALTGVKAFHGGISGEGLGRSATAARSALDAASKRELGILRRLAKGIVEIGYKIMAMNQDFLSNEEIIRITNEDFKLIRREELVGRVDIKLQISTVETDNAKAQELAFMLQTMGNSMPPEMSQIILADIAKLRKMPELAKRIETYQPQPDPMAEQAKQLELAKMQAEIEKIQSETLENKAEAQLDLAKARQAGAETDKTDLDFVEQESGVTQERDLQKQGAQARANAQLKVLDQALKGGNEASGN